MRRGKGGRRETEEGKGGKRKAGGEEGEERKEACNQRKK